MPIAMFRKRRALLAAGLLLLAGCSASRPDAHPSVMMRAGCRCDAAGHRTAAAGER